MALTAILSTGPSALDDLQPSLPPGEIEMPPYARVKHPVGGKGSDGVYWGY